MSSQAGVRRRNGLRLAIVSAAVTALALGPGVAQGDHQGFLELGHDEDVNVETRRTVLFNEQESGSPAVVNGLAVVSRAGIGLEGYGWNAGVRGQGEQNGVQGISLGKGSGVQGINDTASGFGVTGRGETGVFGEGRIYGVRGRSISDNSVGVIGEADVGRSTGVKGVGAFGVVGSGDEIGVIAEGDIVGVRARGPVALKTQGRLVFDRTGVVRLPADEQWVSVCGYETTPDSAVVATIASDTMFFEPSRTLVAYAGGGCVTVGVNIPVRFHIKIAFLILN